MCLVVGLIFGASTIMVTALPDVARDLGASQTSALWLVDIYPLVIAALLMPCGALIDRHGRKRGAVLGLVLTVGFFGAASVVHSAGAVILCLGLAGVGGAFAFPATLATITTVTPKDHRGVAVGIWAASMMGGGTVGGATGGIVAVHAGTSWVFAAPALTALVLLMITIAVVPESNDDRDVNPDPVGSVLSVGGVGLFVLGMIEAPSRGWADPLTLSALLGLLLLIAFVRWELATARPLFDVRLLLEPRFGVGSLVNVLSWFFALGTFFNGVQYRTFTLGYGPVRTGVSLMSMALLTILMGALGPRLARQYGGRVVLAGGLALMSAGSAGIAGAATTNGYWGVALCEVLAFGGLGLIGGPATEAIVDALPDNHQGVASAVNDTTRELGRGDRGGSDGFGFQFRLPSARRRQPQPPPASNAGRDPGLTDRRPARGFPASGPDGAFPARCGPRGGEPRPEPGDGGSEHDPGVRRGLCARRPPQGRDRSAAARVPSEARTGRRRGERYTSARRRNLTRTTRSATAISGYPTESPTVSRIAWNGSADPARQFVSGPAPGARKGVHIPYIPDARSLGARGSGLN
jgi:MFS family permease